MYVCISLSLYIYIYIYSYVIYGPPHPVEGAVPEGPRGVGLRLMDGALARSVAVEHLLDQGQAGGPVRGALINDKL